MSVKEKPVCVTCGSDDIRVDSYSSWNVARQAWEHTAAYDNYVCEGTCGGECDVEWVVVSIPRSPRKRRAITRVDEPVQERTYYCPRGCQTYTGAQHPGECGACGARFDIHPSGYEDALQVIEDSQIAKHESLREKQ